MLEGGTQLDLIAVDDYDARDLPDDPSQRGFVIAHRWALDAASNETIVVVSGDGAVSAQATTPVATTAVLVAMKLSAAPARRDVVAHKRASDVFDLYRLLRAGDAGGEVSAALRDAPDDLASLLANIATDVLVVGAAQTLRWMRSSGSPEMEGITLEDLRAVGVAFRDGLTGAG